MTYAQRPKLEIAYVIPAQPGFHILYAEPGRREFPATVFRLPIIAWGIEVGSNAPYPITPGGIDTDCLPYECPTGCVVESAGHAFSANVAEWLANQQQAYARTRNMSEAALTVLRRQVEYDQAERTESGQ